MDVGYKNGSSEVLSVEIVAGDGNCRLSRLNIRVLLTSCIIMNGRRSWCLLDLWDLPCLNSILIPNLKFPRVLAFPESQILPC